MEAKLSKKTKNLMNSKLRSLSRNMAGRLLSFYGTNNNEDLVRYINTVGNFVASYSDHPDRRYMFDI